MNDEHEELKKLAVATERRIQMLLSGYNPVDKVMTEEAWRALIDAHMLKNHRRTSQFQDQRVQRLHWVLLVFDAEGRDVVFIARATRPELHASMTKYLLENCTRERKARMLIVKSEMRKAGMA